MSSLAVIVGWRSIILAAIVGSKSALFASSRAAVCRPLQVPGLLAVPLFATLKIVADHLKGLAPVAAFLGK